MTLSIPNCLPVWMFSNLIYFPSHLFSTLSSGQCSLGFQVNWVYKGMGKITNKIMKELTSVSKQWLCIPSGAKFH